MRFKNMDKEEIIGQTITDYDDFGTTIYIYLSNGKRIEIDSVDSEPSCRLTETDPLKAVFAKAFGLST